MYYPIIHQCSQALKTIEVWLDKAEQHAAAKKFDVEVGESSWRELFVGGKSRKH